MDVHDNAVNDDVVPPDALCPGDSSGLSSLGYQLNLVAKSARTNFEHRLNEFGGSFASWKVLATLARHGAMIQGDLAETLCIRGPTATRQLDRMIADGLVQRRPVDTDRRKTEITLTSQGERLYRQLAQATEVAHAQLTAGMSADEVHTLRQLLDRLLRNVAE